MVTIVRTIREGQIDHCDEIIRAYYENEEFSLLYEWACDIRQKTGRSTIVYDIFTGAEWTNFNSILDSFTHELDWGINTENKSEDVLIVLIMVFSLHLDI